jgi:hypothetical protein
MVCRCTPVGEFLFYLFYAEQVPYRSPKAHGIGAVNRMVDCAQPSGNRGEKQYAHDATLARFQRRAGGILARPPQTRFRPDVTLVAFYVLWSACREIDSEAAEA